MGLFLYDLNVRKTFLNSETPNSKVIKEKILSLISNQIQMRRNYLQLIPYKQERMRKAEHNTDLLILQTETQGN